MKARRRRQLARRSGQEAAQAARSSGSWCRPAKRPKIPSRLLPHAMEEGDIIIDGGNSFYKDDIRRAAEFKKNGIHYVDAGTSGGVWGVDRGYCLMVGAA